MTTAKPQQIHFTDFEWSIFEPMVAKTVFDAKNPVPRAYLILLNIAKETIQKMGDGQGQGWVVAKAMYPRQRDSEYHACLNLINILIEIGLVKRNPEDQGQVLLS